MRNPARRQRKLLAISEDSSRACDGSARTMGGSSLVVRRESG
jgi:hypothetical protein